MPNKSNERWKQKQQRSYLSTHLLWYCFIRGGIKAFDHQTKCIRSFVQVNTQSTFFPGISDVLSINAINALLCSVPSLCCWCYFGFYVCEYNHFDAYNERQLRNRALMCCVKCPFLVENQHDRKKMTRKIHRFEWLAQLICFVIVWE